MALASQNARKPMTSHVYTSRRGRSRRRRRQSRLRRAAGFGILALLIVSGGFWWLNRQPEPVGAADQPIADASSSPTSAVLPSTASSPSAHFNITNRQTQRTPADKPALSPAKAPTEAVTMTMGKPAGALAKRSATPAPPRASKTKTSAGDSPPAAAIASLIQDADNALVANQPLVARLLLNRALQDARGSASQRQTLRARLTSINNELVFSPRVVEDDPLTDRYVIQPGDSLAKIASKLNLQVDWRLLKRINRITDPRRIRIGQTIKVVHGPFAAVIHKSMYRLDLYALVGEDDSAESRLYIRSFDVGLGQYGSTPVGSWVVRKNSKLINPPWNNPQTGKHFSADNPNNPIGERWIGLAGTDDTTRQLQGYGLHGTIDPDSIGAESSMGCIRLGSDDINVVYEMLVEGASVVEIAP